jgi:hypothetical protein
MRLGRPADGFMGLIISPRYYRMGFIFLVNIFKILKIGCWAVSHLHAMSLGGRDVPWCNFTMVLASR